MITARESPCKESSRFLSGFKKKKQVSSSAMQLAYSIKRNKGMAQNVDNLQGYNHSAL